MTNDILFVSVQIRVENLLNCRITDNLPCATKFELLETGEIQYEHGYKLGFFKDKTVCTFRVSICTLLQIFAI